MSEQMALVKAESAGGIARIRLTRETLAIEREQRSLLGQYVKDCMVEGSDYGKIPGTDKPTLLKPGAEKLVDLFHCTPCFDLLKTEEDFERGFFNYMFRVRLTQRESGAVLAEGFGSANSMEKRYRWRDAQRKCPTCGKGAIIKGKAEYGGGWLCFKKNGGCGAKYGDADTAITDQQTGKVVNEDIADLANTILKMAKKRALVDGSIALARCSDMFTQDVEDFSHESTPPPPSEERRSSKAKEYPAADVPVDPAEAHAAFNQAAASLGQEPPHDVTVGFGPSKGKRISEMDDVQLLAAIELATAKLAEQPGAKWARAMRTNLAALEAEQAFRTQVMKEAAT